MGFKLRVAADTTIKGVEPSFSGSTDLMNQSRKKNSVRPPLSLNMSEDALKFVQTVIGNNEFAATLVTARTSVLNRNPSAETL